MNAGNYNGWTNRQTWVVAVHFDNERSKYFTVLEIIDDAIAENKTKTEVIEIVENFMYDSVEEDISKDEMIYDLIDLSQINFHEVAEHFVEDCFDMFANGDAGGFIADEIIARAERAVSNEE